MKSQTLVQVVSIFVSLFFWSGCVLKDESPVESFNNAVNLIQSDDIVVTNSGNDTIVLLDSDGNFKSVLVDSQTDASLIFNGLTYDSVNKQLLYIYDSTVVALEAVKSLSLYDGTSANVIANGNLTGTLNGLARLTGGQLVVLEAGTGAERFESNGSRNITAPYPLTTLTTSVVDVNRLSDGGFIVCTTGTTNTARKYNLAGTAGTSVTSAAPLPSLGAVAASSCAEDSQGRIVVAYNGATDAIRMYNSTMTTTLWTYTDTTTLSTPGKIAIRSNGNILVTDTTFNHIVELNPNGGLVRVIGGAVLSVPLNIAVIP